MSNSIETGERLKVSFVRSLGKSSTCKVSTCKVMAAVGIVVRFRYRISRFGVVSEQVVAA